MCKKYIVIDRQTDCDGDEYMTLCHTENEAIGEADRQWSRMSSREQCEREIAVAEIETTDLCEDLVSEDSEGWDGEHDWFAFRIYNGVYLRSRELDRWTEENHWTLDSWGDGYPPVNADEVIDAANELIDQHFFRNDGEPEWRLRSFNDKLWEDFCRTGRISEVIAIYDE